MRCKMMKESMIQVICGPAKVKIINIILSAKAIFFIALSLLRALSCSLFRKENRLRQITKDFSIL